MVTTYDIIPDIHGKYDKLLSLLTVTGWSEIKGQWQHQDRGRKIIFLGDFIDRGKQNRKVISLLRKLERSNLAYIIMGNHELNAIYFHSVNPKTGRPLRKHSPEHIAQHKHFLKEYPLNEPETEEVINWFASLPLFLEFDHFRAVHACWANSAVISLKQINNLATFSRDFYIKNILEKNTSYFNVELLAKGPEVRLPENFFFNDKTGLKRHSARLAWWRHEASSLSEVTVSVPNTETLPDLIFQDLHKIEMYPKSEIPVFFGHYWITYPPRIESKNAFCLDCSAGANGPLISYHFNPSSPEFSLKNITVDNVSAVCQ